MKMTSNKTDTYNIGTGYKVDIVTLKNTYEAWIYHKDYGIKELMCGMPKAQQTYRDFIKIVCRNIDNYKQGYEAEYMALPFN